ncbi:MAG: signal peptidase I [Eubacteriales bacterium]|nr:signal peptidase I [Eubacteriales bacterium]
MTKTMTTMRTGTTSNPDPANGKKSALLWLVIPLSAVALAAAVNFLLIVNAVVPSASMEPTVPEGALVVGSRLAYLNRSPKAGDIIIFTHKEFPGKLLIKRVAATEGQRFAVTDGAVYIDGKPMGDAPGDDFPEVIVPAGMLVVLGDNRAHSKDSRYWDDPFVRVSDVRARAEFMYYPRFAALTGSVPAA